MRKAVLRPRLMLSLALFLALAACLTSDPPKLAREDLVQATNLAGNYVAISLPEGMPSQPKPADAEIVAEDGGGYLLTFIEDGHRDSPTLVRLLTFTPGTYLGVLTESESDSSAMYALVSRETDGQWHFKVFDLKRDRRNNGLQPILARHGVGKITFEDLGQNPDSTNDHMQGHLDAKQLRALFGDPDFIAATRMDSGFRLQPKP